MVGGQDAVRALAGGRGLSDLQDRAEQLEILHVEGLALGGMRGGIRVAGAPAHVNLVASCAARPPGGAATGCALVWTTKRPSRIGSSPAWLIATQPVKATHRAESTEALKSDHTWVPFAIEECEYVVTSGHE